MALLAVTARADTTYYDAVVWDFGSSMLVKPGINVTFSPGSTVNATGATLVGFPGGTGSSSFLGLVDTPSSYAGQGGKFVAIKNDVTGLEFVTAPTGGGGGGTVTSFSAGVLAPLFTTAVTNPTTLPALAFTLSTAGSHTFLGNETAGTTLPHYVQPNFTDLAGDFALTQTPSLAAGALVGRTSASAGDWQAITVGSGLALVGTTLTTGTLPGNVLASGTPTVDQLPIWTDATHIKGVNGLTGGLGGQVLKKIDGSDYNWVWAADISGSGGSSTFITLTDVPPSYIGAAGKFVAVNTSANGLEFVAAPVGGGGGVTSVFTRTGAVTAQVGDYSAFYQPLDVDLTNIAALAGQTSFGLGFLTRIDAAGARTYIGAGTSNFDGAFTSLTGRPTTLAGYGITDAQPLDADLTSLAAATGTNTIYYRGSLGAWSPVTPGSNMTFASGTLNAANANWDTGYSERRQWDGGSTNLVPATGRTSLGLDIGTNVQAFDADLSSLAAASSTNAIYYRSATNTWAPVTIGSNMTFASGILNSAIGGDVSGPASSSDVGLVAFSGTTGKVIRVYGGTGIVNLTGGVVSTIVDNSSNWNSAWAQTQQWDGGATGLVAATGRTSLALNNVTNNAQTQAAIVPNTVPTAGQILVGSGTAYLPKTVSGGQATVTMSSAGVITIDQLTNAALASSTIQIGAAPATSLGGSVSLDSLSGVTGAVGLIKRTGAGSSWGIATAGTDYKAAVDSVNVRLITAPGASTYTPTAGVQAIYVECVGGGGGGGGCKNTASNVSGGGQGGGGGGYAAAYVTSPAASYACNVGAPGTFGTTAGSYGGDGGSTNFGAATCTATGGKGGLGITTGSTVGIWWGGGTVGIGGIGTVGSIKASGGDGGPGLTLSSTLSQGGFGGGTFFTGQTLGPIAPGGGAAGNGFAGGGPGGGGSGAAVNGTVGAQGGAGSTGIIRVWEIF